MINSNQWLQTVAQKLAANSYQPLAPEIYQPHGFKYAVRRSRFEITKFGMAENFFVFAEIPNLTVEILRNFSSQAFSLADTNKSSSLPNGIFSATFCFATVITYQINPQLAQYVRETEPIKHWSAFELSAVFDLADGSLYYYEKTPLWGAAYYRGFRNEIQSNLS